MVKVFLKLLGEMTSLHGQENNAVAVKQLLDKNSNVTVEI